MPEVSILMPVRNGEKTIKESINSILRQAFEDFELIIMDDGSTDCTVEIIKSYCDSRIRLEKRSPGFINNLNEGLKLSKGTFIARMDADDIMHSERIRIQVKRMKQKPEITVCGTWMKTFSSTSIPIQLKAMEYEIYNPILEMLKGNLLFHPTTMIRKSFLEQHHLQYENYPCAEDYKLWFDIACHRGLLFIEPQNLLFYRISDYQVTVTRKEEMQQQTLRIKRKILKYLLKQPEYQDEDLSSLYQYIVNIINKKWFAEEHVYSLFYRLLKNKLNQSCKIL